MLSGKFTRQPENNLTRGVVAPEMNWHSNHQSVLSAGLIIHPGYVLSMRFKASRLLTKKGFAYSYPMVK